MLVLIFTIFTFVAPDNTSVHKATQNDELSLSKLSNAVRSYTLFFQ